MFMLMSARYACLANLLVILDHWINNAILLLQQNRVYNGKPDPCGAIHITIGDGGNKEGLARK